LQPFLLGKENIKMNRTTLIRLFVAGFLAILLIYVGSVVWFEARLGINQPQGSTSIVIATFNEGSERHERVLRLEQIDSKNYVAANHWPRAWYRQALSNPLVEVKLPGTEVFTPFTAVPLEGAELDKVAEIYPVGSNFRFRTGYPPRRFMRLDPR
jgi:hypothetical protein